MAETTARVGIIAIPFAFRIAPFHLKKELITGVRDLVVERTATLPPTLLTQ